VATFASHSCCLAITYLSHNQVDIEQTADHPQTSARIPMDESPQLDGSYFTVAVAFEGGLGLLALLIGWLVGHDPGQTIGLTVDTLPGNGWALLWGSLAAVPMFAGLVLVQRLPFRAFERLREALEQLVLPLFEESSVLELALLSLIAGVGEELLFRGLMQHALTTWIGGSTGLWVGLAVASLAFGCAHAITRTYVVLAAIISVYLGLLFFWTGNVLAPVTAHAVYDFIALLYLVKWRASPEPAVTQASAEESDDSP
jgi:membrane protease YdiL (CAAX protease family)